MLLSIDLLIRNKNKERINDMEVDYLDTTIHFYSNKINSLTFKNSNDIFERYRLNFYKQETYISLDLDDKVIYFNLSDSEKKGFNPKYIKKLIMDFNNILCKDNNNEYSLNIHNNYSPIDEDENFVFEKDVAAVFKLKNIKSEIVSLFTFDIESVKIVEKFK